MTVLAEAAPGPDDDYLALAAVYDQWQERFGPFWQLVLPRLLAALDQQRLPPGPPSLVDLGCGTGTLALAVRRRQPRWELAGVDASAAMLARAAEKPDAAQVRWVHASFEQSWIDLPGAPPPAGRYAVATSFFDALNHAASPGALLRSIAATAQALVPGGLFIFDVNNRQGFQAWWQGRRVYQGPGWTLTMDARFDPHTDFAEGRAVVEQRGVQRITAVTERCFSDDELRQALEPAFTVELCTPWSPLPDDVAGKTWWVARRR
jgi:SAM-dependent methyltransferase